jgi:hypothetical protein
VPHSPPAGPDERRRGGLRRPCQGASRQGEPGPSLRRPSSGRRLRGGGRHWARGPGQLEPPGACKPCHSPRASCQLELAQASASPAQCAQHARTGMLILTSTLYTLATTRGTTVTWPSQAGDGPLAPGRADPAPTSLKCRARFRCHWQPTKTPATRNAKVPGGERQARAGPRARGRLKSPAGLRWGSSPGLVMKLLSFQWQNQTRPGRTTELPRGLGRGLELWPPGQPPPPELHWQLQRGAKPPDNEEAPGLSSLHDASSTKPMPVA